jgi:WXG100 family type VII secretion target
MEIVLGYDEMRAAAAEATAVLEQLQRACDRGEAEVARLLDGGWSGAAAASFAEAWAQWCSGAVSVRVGLASLASRVDSSERLAREADCLVTGSWERLEARLS